MIYAIWKDRGRTSRAVFSHSHGKKRLNQALEWMMDDISPSPMVIIISEKDQWDLLK